MGKRKNQEILDAMGIITHYEQMKTEEKRRFRADFCREAELTEAGFYVKKRRSFFNKLERIVATKLIKGKYDCQHGIL